MTGLPDTAVLRIIDANANRAREGLRVVEEYARFCCDDEKLTAQFKDLRHQVSALLQTPPVADALIASRNSAEDVGAGSDAASERERSDVQAVVRANMKRVQEALRALEEYGKLLAPETGAAFKRLRFAAYTLEQDVLQQLK